VFLCVCAEALGDARPMNK